MVLKSPGRPLEQEELDIPVPGRDEVLLRVLACAVCRTDLHVADGELDRPKLPLVLGHEIVGTVVKPGAAAKKWTQGERVGVCWLWHTCGVCRYCRAGRENLCDWAQFTGYQRDGGYAEYTVAHQDFCFPIPSQFETSHAAPLLCAGAIGFRALGMSGDAQKLGLYGFGASAHILAQVAGHQGRQVYAFTRPGDLDSQRYARDLGAVWAGDSNAMPPEPLDAAILFAPVGSLIPAALQATCKGGIVVCSGIHMSDIPSFPYQLLWGERVVRSVANISRADVSQFLTVAAQMRLFTRIQRFALEEANQALAALRSGQTTGTAVFEIAP